MKIEKQAMAAVKRQGPTGLRKALSAFHNWCQEILAFFDFLPTRLSNGFVEGKNNRTKALIRQGFGYPNLYLFSFYHLCLYGYIAPTV